MKDSQGCKFILFEAKNLTCATISALSTTAFFLCCGPLGGSVDKIRPALLELQYRAQDLTKLSDLLAIDHYLGIINPTFYAIGLLGCGLLALIGRKIAKEAQYMFHSMPHQFPDTDE